MVTLASLRAVALYLFPVVFVLWARSTADRKLSSIALDIPIVVAADFMIVLTLARFMRLDFAIQVSRVVWAAAILVFVLYRLLRTPRAGLGYRRWPSFPRALRGRELMIVAVAALSTVTLSLIVSRPYSIWDRVWHTPLVMSLRGQSIPFRNVFNQREVLHYHFSGDIHAAILQSLSSGVIHSSLALSLSHDVAFGLMGVMFALLLRDVGVRRTSAIVVTTFAVLLSGPLTLLRDLKNWHLEGYNFLNYVSMSFRPHEAIGGIFYTGFMGAIIARLWRRGPLRFADTGPALIACTLGCSITDETSIGLLGFTLGIVWLVHPDIVHPRRVVGVALFAGLLISLFVPNLAFAGALSPHAQRHAIAIVPWRAPGCYMQTWPLTTANGIGVLLYDLVPTLGVWLGCALAWPAFDRRTTRPLFVFHSVLFFCSVVALTRLDVNGQATESHRFMTVISFLSPLLGILVLLRVHRASTAAALRFRAAAAAARRRLTPAVVGLGITAGAVSTLDWIMCLIPRKGHKHDHFFTTEDLYAIDCTKDLGGTIGAIARQTYVSRPIWYAYAGCNPLFAPLKRGALYWAISIGSPLWEKDAMRELHRNVAPNAALPVICRRRSSEPENDPICAFAMRNTTCVDSGRLTICSLSAAQRAAVMK